jgi:hypothetical protein
MNTRKAWVVGICFLAGCLLLGAFCGSRSDAEQKAPPSPVGRYQAIQGRANDTSFVVIDTATGQCWTNDARGDASSWRDLGSPGPGKK